MVSFYLIGIDNVNQIHFEDVSPNINVPKKVLNLNSKLFQELFEIAVNSPGDIQKAYRDVPK
jgi:hypothetical protein